MCALLLIFTTIMTNLCLSQFNAVAVGAADCIVQTADNSKWNNYSISAANSYSITAVCRCSIGKPYWQYYDEGASELFVTINENSIDRYCVDNGGACNPTDKEFIGESSSGLYVHAQLSNYFIEESTVLLCGNSEPNYAPGISIAIISETPTVECPNTSTESISSSTSVSATFQITSSSPASTSSIPLQLPSSSTTITTTPLLQTTPIETTSTLLTTSHSALSDKTLPSSTTTTDSITLTTATNTPCNYLTSPSVTAATAQAVDSLETELHQYKTASYVMCAIVFLMMVIILILLAVLVKLCIVMGKGKKHFSVESGVSLQNIKPQP